MKILFTTSSFAGGGITSYAHEVIDNYSNDHEVIVFIGDQGVSPLKNNKVTIYNINCNDISYDNVVKSISLINDIIKPDVIINSNAALITIALPFLLNEIKVVSVAHSLRYIETTTAAYNHKYIDKIISLSDYSKEYMIKRFHVKNTNKFVTIFNFVAEIDRSEEIRERKKSNDVIKIVYPGGSSPSKTPETVVKTIREILKTDLNFKFYWMGSRTPTLKKIQPFKDVKDLFRNDKRLIITGKLPRNEASKLIAEANILFTPSRREGCPMALLEGMRAGTISLIANYKNGNREIISNGYNGFIIKHNDIKGFKYKILDIISNHNRYLKIYENSYSTYLSKLSFPVWKEKMDVVILDKFDCNHVKRKESISKPSYIKNILIYKGLCQYDSIHRFIFEYLKSGLSIFFLYINRNK